MPFENGIPHLDSLFETKTLMGVFEDIRKPQNFWRALSTAGQDTMIFDTEYVAFEKIFKDRKAAPYVRPMATGVPSYDKQSQVRSFKPAFIKLNDPIGPSSYIRKQPGGIATLDQSSPAARKAMAVREILEHHRNMIENRMELMASEVMLTGGLIIHSQEYPRAVLDFGRNPALDVTLAPIERWGEAGVSILDELSEYARIMYDVEHGGTVANIVMGTRAAEVFRKDPEVKELLSTDVRGTTGNINIGVQRPEDWYELGVIAAGQFGIEVRFWVNRQKLIVPDPVTNAPTTVPLMDPDSICLIASDYQAVEAYGLIPDDYAIESGPTDVFVRSYVENNPAVRYILTQTAPLIVPIHENKTMRVKVL